MKKMQKILCMLLALAMLLSFAACAAKEAAPSTTDTPAADAADEKTETKAEDTPAEQPAAELPELTLMLQTSDESNGLLAAVDYVNAHAEEIGAKLILEKVPDGDQGEQVIQVRYAGGEDVPDILYFQPVSYTNSRLSVADNFVDLTANDYSYLYSDSYLRTPGYLLDGKLYNLPIATGGGMYMFYNKDVLAASGITEVPTTWDAFLADCEAIKANGISPVYYSGVDTWTLQFFALMGWYSDYAPEDAQAFADAMSTNQKHWSDMNGFIDSIGKIKELVDLGYVQETYLSDTYQQAQQALLDGTCAFYAQGDWVVGELEKIDADKTASSIGAFLIPLADHLYCGIPVANGVTADLKGPYADIKNILDTADLSPQWTDFCKYSKGPLETYISEVLVGTKTPADVAAALDADFAKAAIDAGDPNWN